MKAKKDKKKKLCGLIHLPLNYNNFCFLVTAKVKGLFDFIKVAFNFGFKCTCTKTFYK